MSCHKIFGGYNKETQRRLTRGAKQYQASIASSIRRIRVLTTECERWFFGSRFSDALLCSLADFMTEMDFSHKKPEHVNAPNIMGVGCVYVQGCIT